MFEDMIKQQREILENVSMIAETVVNYNKATSNLPVLESKMVFPVDSIPIMMTMQENTQIFAIEMNDLQRYSSTNNLSIKESLENIRDYIDKSCDDQSCSKQPDQAEADCEPDQTDCKPETQPHLLGMDKIAIVLHEKDPKEIEEACKRSKNEQQKLEKDINDIEEIKESGAIVYIIK